MKQGILVVSFGTSYPDALKNSIENIENKIRDNFKEYEIVRAFTSHMILKKVKNRDGVHIFNVEEALEYMKNEKFEKVIVQPLHLIAGEEYNYVTKVVNAFRDKFKYIELGRPVFFYQGIEHLPQDYSIFIESIKDILPREQGTVFLGHGTTHPSNASYGCLQYVLENQGYDNVFIGTIEGYPGFKEVLEKVRRRGLKEITLIPLLVVCGDHARNDMASDDEDSWKSMFEKEGIKANILLKGLGEIDKFADIYVDHIKDVIQGEILGEGETKKGDI